jgi:hypothetical protein
MKEGILPKKRTQLWSLESFGLLLNKGHTCNAIVGQN